MSRNHARVREAELIEAELNDVEPNRETAAHRDGNFRRNRASGRATSSPVGSTLSCLCTRYFSPLVENMRVISTQYFGRVVLLVCYHITLSKRRSSTWRLLHLTSAHLTPHYKSSCIS